MTDSAANVPDAAIDRRPWWRSMWCWLAHSRFGRWNEQGDICCARCNVIVWTDAAGSREYRKVWGVIGRG